MSALRDDEIEQLAEEFYKTKQPPGPPAPPYSMAPEWVKAYFRRMAIEDRLRDQERKVIFNLPTNATLMLLERLRNQERRLGESPMDFNKRVNAMPECASPNLIAIGVNLAELGMIKDMMSFMNDDPDIADKLGVSEDSWGTFYQRIQLIHKQLCGLPQDLAEGLQDMERE